MTYQRFSGAFAVSVVGPVIEATTLPRQEPDQVGEHGIEDRDVETHDQADREHEHGQVAGLLRRRPGDLLQFGPRLIDEAPKSSHVRCSSLADLATAINSPTAEAAVPEAIGRRIRRAREP